MACNSTQAEPKPGRDAPGVESRLTPEPFEDFEELEAAHVVPTMPPTVAGIYPERGRDRLPLPDVREVVVAASNVAVDPREAAIRALLTPGPLAPYASEMLAASDSAGIDWRLIPAIAVRESSGGRNACGGNAWGIGSCRPEYRYETWSEGIAAAAALLAGPTYAGKLHELQLCIWVAGPDGCARGWAGDYPAEVLGIMARLGP